MGARYWRDCSAQCDVLERLAGVDKDREVADGMVFMPFCFNESPANKLTNPMLDPYGKIPEFKYCAARVAKKRAFAAERGSRGGVYAFVASAPRQ